MAWPKEKQIEFPELQTHVKWLTPALLLLSIACIVATIIIILVHPSGSFIGPW
jgi:hypothetical protein